MTARATSKTFGQFSSFEAIKSILSLNAKDPDNAPLAGDSATFVDANGNPKTAVYGPTGWYIEGVGKESPDSTSIQFDRVVAAPNVPFYVQLPSRSPTERMRGDGVRAVLYGSSTIASASSYQQLGGSVSNRIICTNSLIWGLNAEGAEIDEVWNGAVAGEQTGSIEAKFNADWNTIKDAMDVVVFAPMFNNLTDPANDLVAGKAAVVRVIRRVVRYGKRMIFIIPFAGTPLSYTNVTHQRYRDYAAWVYATIEAEQGYRGQIIPWDLYNILNPGGAELNVALTDGALTLQPFNQHLTNLGIATVCRHPSSKAVIEAFQIPRTGGADIYGTPAFALDMTTATASGATIASAGNDPDTGEAMYDITSTAALSYATTAALTVDPLKVYRIVGEYELRSTRTTPAADYVDGVKWEDPVAQRIGIYPWINGNSLTYSSRVLGNVKVFGAKWKPNDTSGSIRLFPGSTGAIVRVRGTTPIRMYEVPA